MGQGDSKKQTNEDREDRARSIVIDGRGMRLELERGDVVWAGFNETWSVYIGEGKIIRVEDRTGQAVVEPIELNESFGKCKIRSGRCHIYPPSERLDRANMWAWKMWRGWWFAWNENGAKWDIIDHNQMEKRGLHGTEYKTQGNWDFIAWVITGESFKEAAAKGFRLV